MAAAVLRSAALCRMSGLCRLQTWELWLWCNPMLCPVTVVTAWHLVPGHSLTLSRGSLVTLRHTDGSNFLLIITSAIPITHPSLVWSWSHRFRQTQCLVCDFNSNRVISPNILTEGWGIRFKFYANTWQVTKPTLANIKHSRRKYLQLLISLRITLNYFSIFATNKLKLWQN